MTPSAPLPQAGPGVASRADQLCMGAGFLLCLLISFVFGYKRIFWEDEMLGWMLLRDPSWNHMLFAWNHGADGGGFTFYLTCRAWFALFGASEVAYRMYSATCFGLAFCVLWITARRFYTLPYVAPAVFGAWFLSPPLVTHLAEGRFYGLLMLLVALVLWFTSAGRSSPVPSSAPMSTRVQCVWAFVLNGLLVTSHLLGIVYSAAILGGLILADRVRPGQTTPARSPARSRLPVYAATVASWLWLWPERTAIHATTSVGKPWFWSTPPTLSRFLGAYCGFSAADAALLAVLLLLLWYSRRRPGRSFPDLRVLWHEAMLTRTALLLPVLALLLLPVVLTVQSNLGTSLFINRYLMPLTVAEALVHCQLFAWIDWRALLPQASARSKPIILAGGIVYGALLLAHLFGHLIHQTIADPDYTVALTARLPRGIPVLCEDAWVFTQLIGRQHDSGVYYTYLLDWPQTVSPGAPRLEVTQFHLMQNWKDVGYFAGSIDQREPFLREHGRFLILHRRVPPQKDGPVIGNPLVARFQHTPGFEVVPYDITPKDDMEIWLVCRGSCTARETPQP